MTADERNLLLLLARMVLRPDETPVHDQEIRAMIARIEESQSKARDKFVAKILKGSD